MDDKNFYTTGQIAKLLNVSPATVFRAIDKGKLNASTTPGGHYRIARPDLEAFLEKNNYETSILKPRVKRILVVEDNPVELLFFSRALESDPRWTVKTTDSGYKAGFLTKSFKPDLILLDIFLKDIDGREVVKLIRLDPDLKTTKILAISSALAPDEVAEIKDSGVDDFIAKPASAPALTKKIESLLK